MGREGGGGTWLGGRSRGRVRGGVLGLGLGLGVGVGLEDGGGTQVHRSLVEGRDDLCGRA